MQYGARRYAERCAAMCSTLAAICRKVRRDVQYAGGDMQQGAPRNNKGGAQNVNKCCKKTKCLVS